MYPLHTQPVPGDTTASCPKTQTLDPDPSTSILDIQMPLSLFLLCIDQHDYPGIIESMSVMSRLMFFTLTNIPPVPVFPGFGLVFFLC